MDRNGVGLVSAHIEQAPRGGRDFDKAAVLGLAHRAGQVDGGVSSASACSCSALMSSPGRGTE